MALTTAHVKTQSEKPIYHTADPKETLWFVNHSKHLTIRQAVKLRLRVARLTYHMESK